MLIKTHFMEQLPLYIPLLFAAAVLLTFFFLYKASGNSKRTLLILLAWLVVQSIAGITGFYHQQYSLPPRFLLLVLPPLFLILFFMITKQGWAISGKMNTKWLTWLHVVRIPVEIILLCLFLKGQVPGLMTFEGRNFDVLSGISAILIAYMGYTKFILSKTIILVWNFICLGLLLNIVINAVLSLPYPFQQFGFEQPNVAVLYFPYILLPGFIVPAVLFSHLVCIRQLIHNGVTSNEA